jgi:predicted nucleic acid-binding protein
VTDNGKKRVVAVDTMVLVWAIRKKGPKDKILHAGYLFKELQQAKAQVIVPSIVVAEYIAPINPQDRIKVVAAITERFRIEPFDIKDVVTAAELWDWGRAGRPMQRPGARTALRADSLIVATARNHGATEFYTEDEACFAMANRIMTAKRLPTIAPSLFEQEPD